MAPVLCAVTCNNRYYVSKVICSGKFEFISYCLCHAIPGASIAIDDCYELWESGFISIPHSFQVLPHILSSQSAHNKTHHTHLCWQDSMSLHHCNVAV